MKEEEVQRRRRDQDEASTQQRAAIIGLQYIDTRSIEKTLPLVKDILSNNEMYKGRLVPLVKGENGQPTEFAATAQTPQSLIREMRTEYEEDGRQIQFFLMSNSGFRAFMHRFDPPKTVVYDDIQISNEGDSDTLARVSQTLETVGTTAIFDFLIGQAEKVGASDIHIENERLDIRVRMRVDGALHSVAQISKERYRVIMSELASRAGVSMASSEPQSGHIQHEVRTEEGTHVVNLRVETVPTLHGQDAVLRLFSFDESLLKLDLLGITEHHAREIESVISHPRGLVLMVGPTGSGKSTTLYSILNALNTPDKKIITLEDPIEYGLPGISQIPINTTGGQTFASALRSVLRLDPDVVMVGEIRDEETAKTAIQASITGHLVLSSFHANSTSAAFSRMIDLIGTNPIFSSAVRLVIAQRLVRKLAPDAREEYQPDEATRSYVKKVLKDIPDWYEDKPDLDNFTLYKPIESEENPFGYKGRMVIMEQLVVGEDIQKYLRGDMGDTHAEEIEATAKKNGMLTLEQVGVLAALRGETTLEEVNRVI